MPSRLPKIWLLLALLTACGGPGGKASPTPAQAAPPPVPIDCYADAQSLLSKERVIEIAEEKTRSYGFDPADHRPWTTLCIDGYAVVRGQFADEMRLEVWFAPKLGKRLGQAFRLVHIDHKAPVPEGLIRDERLATRLAVPLCSRVSSSSKPPHRVHEEGSHWIIECAPGEEALSLSAKDGAVSTLAPPGRFTVDEQTARALGRVYLDEVYGYVNVADPWPLVPILHNGIWYVEGTSLGDEVKGGVGRVELDEDSARVVRITHGR